MPKFTPKNYAPPVAYRPEIDGLRAIAVLGVALFHLGLNSFSGGYAGVDVFFVISGFLITQFINARISEGRFSIAEFYERRVRRIVPALFVVCLFVWVVSYFLLLPTDFKSLGASLLSTTTFLANIFFWHKSGYFAAPAATEPLLHTWSLAVEEQFYILFPVFMILIAKTEKTTKKLLLIGSLVLSFVFSAYTVNVASAFAFYWPISRAWEFLLGSLLALDVPSGVQSSSVRCGVSFTGLSLIAFSFIAYTPNTLFPGFAALAPCLGTLLVIWAERPALTVAGKLLSFKPLTWIGLISYSLYLWHWPLIVFARYVLGHALNTKEIIVVLLLSIVLAWASWRFIEQPFRGRKTFTRRGVFLMATVAAGVLIALALTAYLGNGLPYRITAQARAYDLGALDYSPQRAQCLISRSSKPHWCHIGPQGKPQFFLWGDSHAAAMLPAFQAEAFKFRVSGESAAESACAPLLGAYRTNDPKKLCARFNAAVIAKIHASHIHTVFLVARWSMDVAGATSFELDNGMPQIFIQDSKSKTSSLAENKQVFIRSLTRTLLALRGDKVVLMLEAPNPDVMVPTYLAQRANAGLIGKKAYIPWRTRHTYREVQALITPLAKTYRITVLNPSLMLCRHKRCLIAYNGKALYIDNQHLSVHGARYVESILKMEFSAFSHSNRLSDQNAP